MLVLTRRLQETLVIQDNIQIIVLNIRQGQVTLGISAPQDIAVDRQEVYERKCRRKSLPAQESRDNSCSKGE